MLSEISEEDDSSLISDRGVLSPSKVSSTGSNVQSTKLSKEQFIQIMNQRNLDKALEEEKIAASNQ